jgi:hypothetical protein
MHAYLEKTALCPPLYFVMLLISMRQAHSSQNSMVTIRVEVIALPYPAGKAVYLAKQGCLSVDSLRVFMAYIPWLLEFNRGLDFTLKFINSHPMYSPVITTPTVNPATW